MTFQYSKDLEIIENFIYSLVAAYKMDAIPDDYLPEDLHLRELTVSAFSELVQTLKPYRNDLTLFFYHLPGDLCFLSGQLRSVVKARKGILSLEEMLCSLRSLSADAWMLSVLKHYGSASANEESFYRELSRNPSLLISYIRTLDLPDSVKLSIIQFLMAPEVGRNNLCDILTEYSQKFRTVFPVFDVLIRERCPELENKLCEKLFGFLKHYPECTTDEITTVYYGFIIFNSKAGRCGKYDELLLFFSGMEHSMLDDAERKTSLEPSGLFQYLDEPKHLAILSILADGELCVADIHKKLQNQYKIPLPTVSGYMQDLYEMGIVRRYAMGTKSFYSINPEYFSEVEKYFTQVKNSILRR